MRWVVRHIGILFLLISLNSYSQFYNGTSMDFGKNRVQFSGYLWSHYKYDQFNIYFYEEGKNLADYVATSAHLQLKELELLFEHRLNRKIQFVVYNTQNQSRESNIGDYPDEEINPGGFARVLGGKVFLYFDGDHKNFDRQIRNGVAQMLIDEIIFGDGLSDELKSEVLINFPDWFYNGLISYLSEKWSVETENKVKDYFKSGKFKKFNWLKGEEATYAGHSFWYFIADKYGEEAVPNVLYMSKINRSHTDGMLFILGASVDNLILDWGEYFKSRFISDNKFKSVPDTNNIGKRLPKKNREYQRLCVNSKSDYVAFTTNKLSQQKVYVVDYKKQNRKCILKLGHQIDVQPDYSFPVITWHPFGDLLSVFYEHKGEMIWMTYDVRTKEKIKSKLFQFEKILEANYSQSGRKIVMSAVVNGKTDVYVLDVNSRSQEQITDDFYDDRYPVFIDNDELIVFSSNRQNDSMQIGGQANSVYKHSFDLFSYDYKRKKSYKYSPQVLLRLTRTEHANEKNPISIGGKKFQYLSDENGIYNQWEGEIDSVVAFVDTSIHYRYFTKNYPISNYNVNILWQSSNGNQVAKIFKNGGRNVLNISPVESEETSLNPTSFKKFLVKEIGLQPKAEKAPEVEVLTVDSIKARMRRDDDFIYTDYYIFRDEMDKAFNDSVVEVIKPESNTAFRPLKINGFPTSDSVATKVKQRNYELEFRTAEVSLDLDNRFLNPQYQRFSGGASYPMPGMNGFMKYAVIDLLEDHLITGGFRIADFFSNEVFLSYFDRKKRLDKQYLFYRGTHTDLDNLSTLAKNITYEGIYRLQYPFSIVDRLSATFSLRYDQSIPLSKDIALLESPVAHQFWPNVRMDYTFDNTRSLGTNLYSGLRFKVFSEFYQEAPEINNRMYTYGADFRHYLNIYKSLIWANRLAGGSSLGPQRLMFYMGGVDSWASPKFNSDLAPSKLNNVDEYAFQTLATNMRGFVQNGRNGTSFMALNSELRWPVMKFLFSTPFSSDFLNNFQAIGFADVGTAWSGSNPFSKSNSLNEQTILIGGEARTGEILLRTNKEPIIGGYGFGLRSTVMGYFIRADWAWGVEDGVVQGRQFYLSLTTDF